MNDLKTPVARLLRLVRRARDGWKDKALERLRAAQVRIRDLEHSRAYWKTRALAAEGGASARAAADDGSGGEGGDAEPPPWRRWRRGSPTTAIPWR